MSLHSITVIRKNALTYTHTHACTHARPPVSCTNCCLWYAVNISPRVLFGRQRRNRMQQWQQREEPLRNVSLVEAGQGTTHTGTPVAPRINFDDLFQGNTLGTTPAAFVKNRGIRSMGQFRRDIRF